VGSLKNQLFLTEELHALVLLLSHLFGLKLKVLVVSIQNIRLLGLPRELLKELQMTSNQVEFV